MRLAEVTLSQGETMNMMFTLLNEVYARFFTGTPPARTTVQAVLPTDALLEVDVVALQ